MRDGPSQGRTDVLLICMPFHDLRHPALGLSLLKATLLRLGVSAHIRYLSFRLAELIGVDLYLDLRNEGRLAQLGEWVFSGTLFGQSHVDEEGYRREVLCVPRLGSPHVGDSDDLWGGVLTVRAKASRFLDQCLSEILGHRPRIVGFSSIYQQHVPSLALAMLIKAHAPQTFVVFGGANCQGIMGWETIRQFPFVDAVVSGDGDIVFPQLVQRVLADEPVAGLPGVYTKGEPPAESSNGEYPCAPSLQDMDASPYPEYEDYFEQFEASGIRVPIGPLLPMETSRGCWWGARKRCTFCGLNALNRDYRSKSGPRAFEELTRLSETHPGSAIGMTDRILDPRYFRDLIPQLAARPLDLQIAYHVRSTLSKTQVRALRDAGIATIQPGIESLSTPILRLMRKGVSASQNIQLLKWAKEFGLRCSWNFLCGFPTEPPAEYDRMAKLIPLLAHLDPPLTSGPIRIERFSPNFECAEQLGFVDVEPIPAYKHIYPIEAKAVANLAFYFSYDYGVPQNVAEYTKPVMAAIRSWMEAHHGSELFSVDTGTGLLIWDERPVASEPLTTLCGVQRVLYVACDSAQGLSRLQRMAEEHTGAKHSRRNIEEFLQPMLDRGLMIREGSRYLALTIPVGEYRPRPEAWAQFHKHLCAMEEMTLRQALMARITIEELPCDLTVGTEEIRNALHVASIP